MRRLQPIKNDLKQKQFNSKISEANGISSESSE